MTQSTENTEQILYQNERTKVRKGTDSEGCPTVLKTAFGADAKRKLNHEATLLRRLAHIPGVVRLTAHHEEQGTLEMRDEGGVDLPTFLNSRNLSASQAAAFGMALARILDAVHKAGLIHKDVGPGNLLIHPDTLAPTLIDFNIAQDLDQEQGKASAAAELSGTLAYMSPEQTGRTSNAPDERSDLYSLGVTLYELLTGRKPFESEDVLELVHDHLVKVPTAPRHAHPEVPPLLSDMVMRLLEKEPARRYQSAEGLAQDLSRLLDALDKGTQPDFALGQFDFGKKLLGTTRLIGREPELAELKDLLGSHGTSVRALVVTGTQGSGKSTLLRRAREMAFAQKAWCVYERFGEPGSSGLEGLQSLAKQLLAEPEDRLREHKARIQEALRDCLDAPLLALPQFELLLGAQQATQTAQTAQVSEAPAASAEHDIHAALNLLRAVATPHRPLVFALDDLHLANASWLRLLAEMFNGQAALPHVLLVATLDDTRLADKPDTAQQLRRIWTQHEGGQKLLRLAAFNSAEAASFVGETLHMPMPQARLLAELLADGTGLNPGRMLALLDGLRHAGLLAPNQGAWQWSDRAVLSYVGEGCCPDVLGRRVAGLPAPTQDLLRALHALGGKAQAGVLAHACALDDASLATALEAGLHEGLLLRCGDTEAASAHDIALAHPCLMPVLEDADVRQRHLLLARRLSQTGELSHAPIVAAQYLAASSLLDAQCDKAEQQAIAQRFAEAAERIGMRSPAEMEPYLVQAIALLSTLDHEGHEGDQARHRVQIFELAARRHYALSLLGRLDEAEALYGWLAPMAPDAVSLVMPTRVQMFMFVKLRRFVEAQELGVAMLARLGLHKPPKEELPKALGAGLQRIIKWVRSDDKLQDFTKPEPTDSNITAMSTIIGAMATASYFFDPLSFAWGVAEAHRIWSEHAPNETTGTITSAVPFLLVGTPQDYRGAYDASRHIVAVAKARGYEQAEAEGRCIYGIAAGHWVEPIESVIHELLAARERLAKSKDMSFYAFTFLAGDLLFDSSPNLAAADADVAMALAVAANSGNLDLEQRYVPRRQLFRALRGETQAPGDFNDADFDEAAHLAKLDPTGTTAAVHHMVRAIGACIFGDAERLAQHAGAAFPLLGRAPGYYLTALTRVMQAVALCNKARALPAHSPDEQEAIRQNLDDSCVKWLNLRAADAPENFLHLKLWVDAERAWAFDSVWAAGLAFDAAVQESLRHPRPWHQALIHERAGLFHLAQGMEHTAKPLLTRACDGYNAFGAAGKVKEMRRQHAFLRSTNRHRNGTGARSTMVETDMVDMIAVLRASQALSSETHLSKLTDRVGKVLGALTGATHVQLVIHPEEGSRQWVLAHSVGQGHAPLSIDDAGRQGQFPLSVFRYVERTGETLVIGDAVQDERFSGDPYVEQLEQCAMLMAPVLKQGQLHAMLVLENHQRRNAFVGDRLDAVSMIAGQLSVSLDNALLYASLERRVAERTAQLRQKTLDIQAMLQNMPQGVLTMVAGGVVHPEYSAYLSTILETSDIADQPLMDLMFGHSNLGADALDSVKTVLESSIGEDEMNYEFNCHLLAGEVDKTMPDGRVKSLALTWSPIVADDGNVEKIMLCVRDVTELKRLEHDANERKRELQLISEILAVSQEKFQEFIDSSVKFVDENRRLIEQHGDKSADVIGLLFRNMHTIKGNARTYGLLGMTNQVHVTEQTYDDLRKDTGAQWDQALLLAQLDEVRSLVAQYAHINDEVLGRKGPGRRGSVDKFVMVEQDTVHRTLQMLARVDRHDTAALRDAVEQVSNTLNLIGTEPLREVLSGTIDSLPSLAKELGKDAPVVHIEDHGVVIRKQASGLLKNLFTHLLRNSVDHGIEPMEVRVSKGKPQAGRITIDLSVDDGQLRISLRDDGKGLAIGRIRQKAIEQGWMSKDQDIASEEVAMFIFKSGVSTAEQVTEISGRGVGMDAVKGFIEKEGGSIALRFLDEGEGEGADFRPFETVICLPDRYAASVHLPQVLASVMAGAPRAGEPA